MASCERDDFLEKELPSGSYPVKYSTKTYQELENNTAFTSTFTALHQHFNVGSTSLQGRGSYMEDQYGFSIDSSVVEVAKTDKYTSYTMYISRAEHPTHYFENLVIEVTDTAATKAYVVQYFPTSSIKPVPEHDSYAFGYDFNFIPIKYNEGSKIDAGGCTPITVTICYESWGDGSDTPHLKTEFCNNPLYLTSYIIGGNCAGNSGDGPSFPNDSPTQGNNSGPSYPYNPGGGGSNNNGNTTITNPLLCYKTQVDCPPELENWDTLKDPCDKITDLFEDFPSYKSELISLAAKTSEQVENGIFIDESSNHVQDMPQGESGKIIFSNNPEYAYISFAHTHDASGTYSVFSWDDLALIARAAENGKIETNKFVAFLITAKGTRYALTIEDVSKLTDFLYQPSSSVGAQVDVSKMLKTNAIYEKYYEAKNAVIKKNNNNNEAVQKAFLQMLKDNDAGVEIFNVDVTFNNFQKLTLESDNTTITPTECNQ